MKFSSSHPDGATKFCYHWLDRNAINVNRDKQKLGRGRKLTKTEIDNHNFEQFHSDDNKNKTRVEQWAGVKVGAPFSFKYSKEITQNLQIHSIPELTETSWEKKYQNTIPTPRKSQTNYINFLWFKQNTIWTSLRFPPEAIID